MESRNHLVTTDPLESFCDDHLDAMSYLSYLGTATNVAVTPEPLTLEKIERIKKMMHGGQ